MLCLTDAILKDGSRMTGKEASKNYFQDSASGR
jgi:hypothetical protein